MIKMPGRFAWGTEVRIKEIEREREEWAVGGEHQR